MHCDVAGEGLAVKRLALLFTDLKASTALYERIGDLKAFDLVRLHFDYLRESIAVNSGALVKTIVSTAPSHPTRSRFFQAGVPGCETCATFHGDYINISYGSNGTAHMAWTDMRDPSDLPGLFFQYIYYARK